MLQCIACSHLPHNVLHSPIVRPESPWTKDASRRKDPLRLDASGHLICYTQTNVNARTQTQTNVGRHTQTNADEHRRPQTRTQEYVYANEQFLPLHSSLSIYSLTTGTHGCLSSSSSIYALMTSLIPGPSTLIKTLADGKAWEWGCHKTTCI